MAATITIKEANGAGPSINTITALRLCTKDVHNPGTTYPLVKPTSGTNRSFWKSFYLNADTAPTGTINNIKFYCDGSIGWTGITLYVGTTPTYTEASGTDGETGDDSGVATDNIEDYTSASPLTVSGAIHNPTTGKMCDYVVLQADLSTSAVLGALSAETLTWSYDET